MSDDQFSFADIVSNLLCVVILITLLTVVLSGGMRLIVDRSDPSDQSRLTFYEPPRSNLPPLSDYVVMRDGRAYSLSFGAVSKAIVGTAAPTEPTDAYIVGEASVYDGDGGRTRFRLRRRFAGQRLGIPGVDDMFERDFDQFEIEIAPPAKNAQALGGTGSSDELQNALIAGRSHLRAYSFIVYQSGFDLFAAIYPGLVDNGVRFRWELWQEDQPIRRHRRPNQFQFYDFRR